jgi:3-deoxy-manno-octulosonate cytidylyltransferase (CMP-KDO synthetase)
VGIYAYRRDFLLNYAQLPRPPLEQAEQLEQLRVLAAGYRIKVGLTPYRSIGIDTREDFEAFCRLVSSKRRGGVD